MITLFATDARARELLRQYFEERVRALHADLESLELDRDSTAQVRGRIAECRQGLRAISEERIGKFIAATGAATANYDT